MRFIELFERTDLEAIQRIQGDLKLITDGLTAFFEGVLQCFYEEKDVNDPVLLDRLNSLTWNGIDIGNWNVRWYRDNTAKKNGTQASVSMPERSLTLQLLHPVALKLGRLLNSYRPLMWYLNPANGPQQQRHIEKVADIRKQAETAVKGVLSKFRSPEFQSTLSHEIHHADDYEDERKWFWKSKLSVMKKDQKVYDKSKKWVSSLGTKVSLPGKFRTRDTSNSADRSEVANAIADHLRSQNYHGSSHEYNANTRAAIGQALKQKTFPKAVNTFKKSYQTLPVVPDKLKKKSLSRLWQAWKGSQ